jgi:predicted dehydrogenase
MTEEETTMAETNRRTFLKTSALAGTSAWVSRGGMAFGGGANERVRVGLLGMGNRMRAHVTALHELAKENVEIAAVCDCDRRKLDTVPDRYPELAGKQVKTYTDMRRMFEDESIDAIDISTPDHWHSLATIWACQAGKDVYVEKPGAHDIFESRQMLEAARKYKRMVQHGTQCRTSPNICEGIQRLHDGAIGDVYMGRAISFKLRGNLGQNVEKAVPEGLDWDAWLGPAGKQPYSEFRHHLWHWLWNTGSGEMGVQAIHHVDLLRWGMKLEEHPTQIQSMGGILVQQDTGRETPDNQTVSYRFGGRDVMVTFEHRSWITPSEAGFREPYPFVQPDFPVGAVFFGTEGYMIFPDYSSYYTFLGNKREPGPSKRAEGTPMMDTEHFRNWVGAIRSRNRDDLNAEIGKGHKSLVMILLANVAYRTGRAIEFDPETERCLGDEDANELVNPGSRTPYTVPREV